VVNPGKRLTPWPTAPRVHRVTGWVHQAARTPAGPVYLSGGGHSAITSLAPSMDCPRHRLVRLGPVTPTASLVLNDRTVLLAGTTEARSSARAPRRLPAPTSRSGSAPPAHQALARFAEISRQEAYRQMVGFLGDEAADAVLDLTGGDVNDELLMVRDAVSQIIGAPGRTFHQWASENAAAFR
jgi:hypothetical protein